MDSSAHCFLDSVCCKERTFKDTKKRSELHHREKERIRQMGRSKSMASNSLETNRQNCKDKPEGLSRSARG
jgi:hypothetical protein